MPCYAIGLLSVTDPAPLEQYLASAADVIAAHGGRVIAAGPVVATLEGQECTSGVVIEFESADAAKAWYDSDDYRAIRGLRQAAGDNSLLLLDGVPGAS